MKGNIVLTSLAALVLCAVPVLAQEKGGTPGAPDMDEMMKKWAEYATPGAGHKVFEKMVGNWTYSNKVWMDPASPPQESKGTGSFKMILGGRYLEQSYSGEFMGQPFEGMGIIGYDNFRKNYVSSWADNTGTGIMDMTGTAATNGDVVFTGTVDDPVMGQKDKKFRQVIHFENPDTFVLEMYDVSGPKEFKMMEITHSRAR